VEGHGIEYEYHTDGKKMYYGGYKKGMCDGHGIQYHTDGKKIYEGGFKTASMRDMVHIFMQVVLVMKVDFQTIYIMDVC